MNDGMSSSVPRFERWLSVLVPALALAAVTGCRGRDEPITKEFTETFDRDDLGAGWRDTGGKFRLEKGELVGRDIRHNPVWLRKELPPDASFEFDVRTATPAASIRVILYGDGKSKTPEQEGCQSTGYALVFGGWNNKLSVMCRGDQANAGHVRARADWPVVPDLTYHFYVTRKGGELAWFIGGHDMMKWFDPAPLKGEGHTAFGIDGEGGEVFFDNLTIAPLPPS